MILSDKEMVLLSVFNLTAKDIEKMSPLETYRYCCAEALVRNDISESIKATVARCYSALKKNASIYESSKFSNLIEQ